MLLHAGATRAPASVDHLDADGCAEDGAPDWNTMIVVGPIKRRDQHGNVTMEWTATVQCQQHP